MLKVAHVIKIFNVGGAEILLRETFENADFINKKTDSSLIILNKNFTSLLNDSNRNKAYIFNLFSPIFIFEYIRLYRLLKKGKFDVIHCHLPLSGISILGLKIFGLKSKVVYSEHTLPSKYHKITYKVLGYLYGYFDAVIFVSNAVKSDADKIKTKSFFAYKKGVIINNGINLDKFNYVEKPLPVQITVGAIASIRAVKRFDLWLEIAAQLNRNMPGKFKFILAGDGIDMPNVKALIDKLKLNNIVETPGVIYNTAPFYQKLDVFLMTSDWEGLPVALLESMASGCIPVVSDVGGIAQLDLNRFGKKYDNTNLATAINYISNLQEGRETIMLKKHEANKFVVENFSMDSQLKSILALYNTLK